MMLSYHKCISQKKTRNCKQKPHIFQKHDTPANTTQKPGASAHLDLIETQPISFFLLPVTFNLSVQLNREVR